MNSTIKIKKPLARCFTRIFQITKQINQKIVNLIENLNSLEININGHINTTEIIDIALRSMIDTEAKKIKISALPTNTVFLNINKKIDEIYLPMDVNMILQAIDIQYYSRDLLYTKEEVDLLIDNLKKELMS